MIFRFLKKASLPIRVGLSVFCCFGFSAISADAINQSSFPITQGSSVNLSVCVWQSIQNSVHIVQSSFVSSGEWSPPVTVSDPKLDSQSPEIMVDSNGNAVVVWYSLDPVTGGSAIFSSSLAYGAKGVWSTPAMLTVPSSESFTEVPNNDYSITFNPDNSVVVTWSASITGYKFAVIRGISGTWNGSNVDWGTPVTISTGNT